MFRPTNESSHLLGHLRPRQPHAQPHVGHAQRRRVVGPYIQKKKGGQFKNLASYLFGGAVVASIGSL